MQSSVSFTLPLSCQICLGKVKEPVTCSNQHVFCSSCINVWLDRNSRCPTCRVEITSQSPLRKIIGGTLESKEEANISRETARELRRARFELVLKEYEDEIIRLENEVDNLQKQNTGLKKQVETNSESVASSSSRLRVKYGQFCSRCCDITNWDEMLDLSKKLQEATNTYAGMKQELTEATKKNDELLKNNDDLVRENKRIREEFVARSPMKYGRLTVATLESRLEASQREIEQLKRALELSDSYVASLEKDLKVHKEELTLKGVKEDVVVKNETDSQFAAIVNPPLSDQASQSLSQGYDGKAGFREEPKPYSFFDGGCSIAYDETSKASSFFELQDLEDSFTPPVSSNLPSNFSSTSPINRGPLSDFNRKLQFDQPDETFLSSQEACYSFVPVDSQGSTGEDSQIFNQAVCPVTKPLHNSEEKGPWLQASPSTTKTVINAGGSRITMSQFSADDHDRFSRPSSAPSRTFLLSGSRFSALRPLDPHCNETGFQPVKCISPMHMIPGPSFDAEKRSTSPQLHLVAPGDVIDPKYRKIEGSKVDDDARSKEVLSRVNILKRKTSARTPPVYTTVTSSPVGEGRRKQKLYQKRVVEVSFQSPQKLQKSQPK